MIQQICDITLTVADLRRSVKFYGEIIGLRKIYETGDKARFDAGGVEIELIAGRNAERPRQGEPDIGFSVDDINASFRYFRENKIHCIEPPHETAEGTMAAAFTDPDGNRLRLVQPDGINRSER